MTTPIDWNRAHNQLATLRDAPRVLAQMSGDFERVHVAYDEMFLGLRNRDEYIEHLERRLAELRPVPPVTVLGALAALEGSGVKVLRVLAGLPGEVITVVLLWPGDDHPTEHRIPDTEPGGQARFAADLREHAASLNADTNPNEAAS